MISRRLMISFSNAWFWEIWNCQVLHYWRSGQCHPRSVTLVSHWIPIGVPLGNSMGLGFTETQNDRIGLIGLAALQAFWCITFIPSTKRLGRIWRWKFTKMDNVTSILHPSGHSAGLPGCLSHELQPGEGHDDTTTRRDFDIFDSTSSTASELITVDTMTETTEIRTAKVTEYKARFPHPADFLTYLHTHPFIAIIPCHNVHPCPTVLQVT